MRYFLTRLLPLLDALLGFADCVSLSDGKPWCRPVLRAPEDEDPNNNTGMVIRNGRYGIDVSKHGHSVLDGPQEFVANDTYTTKETNFTVITGINGSGERTETIETFVLPDFAD